MTQKQALALKQVFQLSILAQELCETLASDKPSESFTQIKSLNKKGYELMSGEITDETEVRLKEIVDEIEQMKTQYPKGGISFESSDAVKVSKEERIY